MLAVGGITVYGKIDFESSVRGVVQSIEFDSSIDDLASAESRRLPHQACDIMAHTRRWSLRTSDSVHPGNDEHNVGIGYQNIVFVRAHPSSGRGPHSRRVHGGRFEKEQQYLVAG